MSANKEVRKTKPLVKVVETAGIFRVCEEDGSVVMSGPNARTPSDGGGFQPKYTRGEADFIAEAINARRTRAETTLGYENITGKPIFAQPAKPEPVHEPEPPKPAPKPEPAPAPVKAQAPAPAPAKPTQRSNR